MSTARYKGEHYVLVGPKGRQAGIKGQQKIALQLLALNLTAAGAGGGIISLLLPRNKREMEKLESYIDRGYQAKKVMIRHSFRQDLRNAISGTDLLAELAVLFYIERNKSYRSMAAVVREFSNWICEKLLDPTPNKVQRIVARYHSELLTRTSPDWWRKQIAQRKK